MEQLVHRKFPYCGVLVALLIELLGTNVQTEAGSPLRLSQPIACELGKTCFIQNYVDVDPGPGVRDYACGSATYEGHTGTDFRLQSAAETEKKVAVLAAADGTVKGRRDGMADAFANEASGQGLKGRECGNGVVIDHGDGWETQYCHMRQGSIAVNVGDSVARGQHLGDVGYSGLAEFAHLHLAVRHSGEVIDPFSGRGLDGSCISDPGKATGLWDEAAAAALQYHGGEVFAATFTATVPVLHELEREHAGAKPDGQSEQLIFFARVSNLRGGDRIRLAVKGPAAFDVETLTEPLSRNKATYMAYIGRRRTAPSWPAGEYEGQAQLLRGGAVISEMRAEFTLTD
jgi:hypothetical protein